MSAAKKLLSAIMALILAVSLCAFASAANAGSKEKKAAEPAGGLTKIAKYMPKEISKYLSENFKEVELTEIAKEAGMKVSLENKDDSINPYIDIWVVDNLQPDTETYAREEAANFGSTAYEIDIPGTDKDCFGYTSLEYYYGTPYYTFTLITDIGNKKLIEYVIFLKTNVVKIGSSGKTMVIPASARKNKSDRDYAVCCYDFDTDKNTFTPEKITIYEWDCKDADQFAKDLLAVYRKNNGVGMSFVPLDHEQAVILQYPDAGSDHYSEDYAFYKDGKAYSVEFDVSPATSDTIHLIVNSIH